MDISRHRYFYDRIAENEMNDRNRDEIRRRMIPFLYRLRDGPPEFGFSFRT